MKKPKLTWANIKKDKWFLFQIALVTVALVFYYIVAV